MKNTVSWLYISARIKDLKVSVLSVRTTGFLMQWSLGLCRTVYGRALYRYALNKHASATGAGESGILRNALQATGWIEQVVAFEHFHGIMDGMAARTPL